MAGTIVNLYQAKTGLSALVERAAAGETIVIAKAGKPMARLVPLEKPKRKIGGWEGKVWIAPDFDDPLPPDIQAAFEGRGNEELDPKPAAASEPASGPSPPGSKPPVSTT